MVTAAVLAALASAFCFALAASFQQREAFRTTASGVVDLGLLWRLAHRPRWLAGIAADIVSAGLHVLALSLGPVTLVQPLGVTGLLFALPLAAVVHHQRIRTSDVVAAVAVLGGLILILQLLPGSPGSGVSAPRAIIAIMAATIALIIGAAGLARIVTGRLRALTLAGAAGTAFGVTAVLIRTIIELIGQPKTGASIGWAAAGALVLVASGYLMLQSAYRVGHFAASLAIAIVVDPLAALVAAAVLLHEPLPSAPGEVAALIAGGFIVAIGIAALASSPAHLLDPPTASPKAEDENAHRWSDELSPRHRRSRCRRG